MILSGIQRPQTADASRRRPGATDRRGRGRALLLTALIPATLAAGVVTAGAANAAPAATSSSADAQFQPQYSRGFDITNHGTHQLKLATVTGDAFDSRPDIGHILMPGATDDFEVTFLFLKDQYDHATYDILDDKGNTIGTYTADMTVLSGAGMPTSGCSITVGRCTPNPPDGPDTPGRSPYPLDVYDS